MPHNDSSIVLSQNEREADEAKHRPIVPPNMTTPIEVHALAYFTTWVANVSKWAAEASGGRVSVGAIMLDQEAFSDGASLDPTSLKEQLRRNFGIRTTPAELGALIVHFDKVRRRGRLITTAESRCA